MILMKSGGKKKALICGRRKNMECKECGTLLESEPYYKFKFRVKDIPKILVKEAEDRYEAKKARGDYTGYYGSRGRLVRIELEKVVLSHLRFWYDEEEIKARQVPKD
jgi:hypothetical protein